MTEGLKLETVPFDARFPNQNQTRNCWQNFVDFHRCAKAKGDDFPPCLAFKKAYLSLCPSAWVEKWTEQLENGTFPAKGLVEEKHGHDDGHGHH
ncbi:cytochrome c oxidase polypeptide vib [Hyaloraphidium curvatum]|nr:cytochrome c oxidase polypeptide vib [Hyaloraphidium curvatum]